MTDFIESLRRLYLGKRLTLEQLNELYSNKKITEEQFKYITKKEA